MPPTDYCVYNETRSSCLTLRVIIIDAQAEPLKAVKALIEGLPPQTEPDAVSALWLNPLKSIPSVPRLSPYDLVYLDHEGRIVHSIELVPDDEVPRYDGPAASALVLPLHSFNASSSTRGDRVILRPIPEAVPDFVPSAFSLAAAPQASLPLEPAAPEPGPARAWTSTFTANPFVPDAPLPRQARFWPDLPPVPLQPALPFDETGPALPVPRAKKLAAFHLLRSIARLRIGVRISITLEPSAAQSTSLATVPVPSNPNTAQPQEQIQPRPARRAALPSAAIARIRQAPLASLRRFISQYAQAHTALHHFSTRLSDRCAFFATVTLPILFEHTLPAAADRSRRSFVRACSSSKKIYLLWADALFEDPRSASINRPLRRPPASVRPVEPRRDPVRQLLRPPS
jgi:hypothetical protein